MAISHIDCGALDRSPSERLITIPQITENRVLLQGGRIISMDPSVGDLPRGDVLIEGARISQVAPSIEAPTADVFDASQMIVIPGFVDTHRHTWQTAIKGMSSDWSLPEYLAGIRGKIGPQFTPDDVYAATRLWPERWRS